jgi:hypothetical protein
VATIIAGIVFYICYARMSLQKATISTTSKAGILTFFQKRK